MIARNTCHGALVSAVAVVIAVPLPAQVDTALARRWFHEADSLCNAEGGRLWGRSLCGPMVFADAKTGTIATNRPVPEGPRPRILGYANSAWEWGGARWSTFVWSMIPADSAPMRGRLMIHELFHRIQPELGLFVKAAPENGHLDTMDGRYWLQLEWRALALALSSTGSARRAAIADALGFRAERRTLFASAAAAERPVEINEGLPQYTGTLVAARDRVFAVADAIRQLADVTRLESFVRTFAYPLGTAYGLLLDDFDPSWRSHLTAEDDLGVLLQRASGVMRTQDVEAAAARYDGAALLASERAREAARLTRVAGLRARFIEGPVVIVPRGTGATFTTTGLTPLGEAGTVVPQYRVSGPWGSLEADQVLVATDQSTLTLPGPATIAGNVLRGDGWTVTLADGWTTVAGARDGDLTVVVARP